jgi:8-oxo-dGTP pyrophosphatase MutT (NUDIX family)
VSKGRYSKLGIDWNIGEDGVRWRTSARVIILSDDGRALLVRGHDADTNPVRSWWFTVGGGINPGESPRAAAVRELWEETNLTVSESDLRGPVVLREAIFDFASETCRQSETFFVVVVPHTEMPDDDPRLKGNHWQDAEAEVLDELAWFTPEQLLNQPLEVFPKELPDILELLITGEWDGEAIQLGQQQE